MEKETLLKKLREIRARQDNDALRENRYEDEEVDHFQADNFLIDFVDDEEIAKAFNDIKKWYA